MSGKCKWLLQSGKVQLDEFVGRPPVGNHITARWVATNVKGVQR